MKDTAPDYLKALFLQAIEANTFNGEVDKDLAAEDCSLAAHEFLLQFSSKFVSDERLKLILLRITVNEFEERI